MWIYVIHWIDSLFLVYSSSNSSLIFHILSPSQPLFFHSFIYLPTLFLGKDGQGTFCCCILKLSCNCTACIRKALRQQPHGLTLSGDAASLHHSITPASSAAVAVACHRTTEVSCSWQRSRSSRISLVSSASADSTRTAQNKKRQLLQEAAMNREEDGRSTHILRDLTLTFTWTGLQLICCMFFCFQLPSQVLQSDRSSSDSFTCSQILCNGK